jgi:hypothetical protein
MRFDSSFPQTISAHRIEVEYKVSASSSWPIYRSRSGRETFMEITVIDESDHVGWMASATRTEEIYMQDVRSMVQNVLSTLESHRPYSRVCSPNQPSARISRLNILDHGNPTGIEIGRDWVDMATLPRFETTLGMLRGKFSPGGFVHLQHCNIGSNRDLMIRLARVFNVSVYAGTGAHNPVYRFNFGDYARATSGGTYTVGVARP